MLSLGYAHALAGTVNEVSDTGKLNAFEKQIQRLKSSGKQQDAAYYSKAAILLSKKKAANYKLFSFYNNLSFIYLALGKLDTAFLYADSSLKQAYVNKNAQQISVAHRSMGILYHTRGNLPQALSSFLTAQKYIETTSDSVEIARSLVNLGAIYREIKDFDRSLACNNKALVIQEKLNDNAGKAKTLNNIGIYYDDIGLDSLALDYYRKSLDISVSLNDKQAIALRRANIGALLTDMGHYKEAEEELIKSIEIRKEMNDQRAISSSYIKLAELYLMIKDYTKALNYIELTEAINYNSNENLMQINGVRYRVYEQLGDYRKALEHLKKYTAYKDTLNNEEKNRAVAEISSRYEYDKKEKEIALLTQEKKISTLEIERQSDKITRFQYGIVFSSLAVLFLVLSVFLLYSRYNNKKKLSQELERKNTQITRSINYAKRIQGALIPSKYLLVNYFSESFILFKPKDIVSGDFYWISDQKDKIIIAVADCTGHGIPGAFLSMIGNTLLNEIVNQKAIYSPAEILTQLNSSIITTLGQTNVNLATQDDGMDISICCFYKKTNELLFSGANHSLTLFKNKELFIIKGDLFSIGGFSKNFSKNFTEHKISNLQKGDMLYLFTDGYFDQFGGPNRKKFMSQRFKNLLLDIHAQPIDKQKNILEKTLEEWQGKESQTDDILVMGLRI